jgi:hypothetical protein
MQVFQPERVSILHDRLTLHGHDSSSPSPGPTGGIEALILAQHQANFDLWHTEDIARAPHVTGDEMVRIKRRIDQLNQHRNDLAEQIDVALLALAPTGFDAASLHSESPGLMIDRLSILALKIFHTTEETRRPEAARDHHLRNEVRLAMLKEQRDDLACALAQLWSDVVGGTRRFKLYRQLKMYNDPSLNPVLYNLKKD